MNTTAKSLGCRSILLGCLCAGLAWLSGCGGGAAKSDRPATAPGTYAFWPPFPSDPHVQFIRGYRGSEDVAPTKASGLEQLVFGKELADSQTINKPYGVALRNGRLYITDIRNRCLTVMDFKQKQTRVVGATGLNQLKRPVAVAVADDGVIYVADMERGAILVYDAAERYSRAYGHPNLKPASLAVYGDRLYIAEMTSQSIEILNRNDGSPLGSIGSVGDEDGQFRLPLGVATDKQGNIYVMDMMRCRLQKFSSDGKFLAGVGTRGDTAGTFARPKHIAVDSEGIVYVVDAAFQNVQLFDDQMRLLMHFGAIGGFPGSMDLPAGIAVSDDGLDLFQDKIHPGFKAKRLIVVSNQFGEDKITLYALGELKPGVSAQTLAAVAIPVDPGVAPLSPEAAKLASPGAEEPLGPVDAPKPQAPKETGGPPSNPPSNPPSTPPSTSPKPGEPK